MREHPPASLMNPYSSRRRQFLVRRNFIESGALSANLPANLSYAALRPNRC
jgi:hypothetical protein